MRQRRQKTIVYNTSTNRHRFDEGAGDEGSPTMQSLTMQLETTPGRKDNSDMTGIQMYYPPMMMMGETKKIIMWGV